MDYVQEREFLRCFVALPAASRVGRPHERAAGELDGLGNVFASDRQLLRRFDAHLHAFAGPTEQCDLDWTIGEQLGHGHADVDSIRRLDGDGFIGATAQY
jgi:hypothetical protein